MGSKATRGQELVEVLRLCYTHKRGHAVRDRADGSDDLHLATKHLPHCLHNHRDRPVACLVNNHRLVGLIVESVDHSAHGVGQFLSFRIVVHQEFVLMPRRSQTVQCSTQSRGGRHMGHRVLVQDSRQHR